MIMFKQLFNRMFRSTGTGACAVAERVDALADGAVPTGKLLAVIADRRLANIYTESPPAVRAAGEQWWLVAAGEVRISTEVDCRGGSLTVEIDVRAETDGDLLLLLAGRKDRVSHEDVVCLVTSQLAGLLQVDELAAETLAAADAEMLETLRARLSLLLHAHGLRCIRLGEFEHVLVECEVVESQEEPQSEACEIDCEQLAEVIAAIESAQQWEELAEAVQVCSAGLPPESAEEIERIGEAVLFRSISTDAAADRVHQLAIEARTQAGVPPADLRRFRGLALRLQSHDFRDGGGEGRSGDAPSAWPEPATRQRSALGSLRSGSVDARLRDFLSSTVRELESYLASATCQQQPAANLVKLRAIDERLQLIKHLLETNPTLYRAAGSAAASSRIPALVRAVERAVTLAEATVGQVRVLLKLDHDSDAWGSACDAVSTNLDRMAGELQDRRAVRL